MVVNLNMDIETRLANMYKSWQRRSLLKTEKRCRLMSFGALCEW